MLQKVASTDDITPVFRKYSVHMAEDICVDTKFLCLATDISPAYYFSQHIPTTLLPVPHH